MALRLCTRAELDTDLGAVQGGPVRTVASGVDRNPVVVGIQARLKN